MKRTIGILAEQRYLSQVQPAGLMAALAARGHEVELVVPDHRAEEIDDRPWATAFDAVVARGRSAMLLLLLTWAERQGTPTMNRSAGIRAVHDKAAMAKVLAMAGLPTPKTWVGPVAQLRRRLTSQEAFPLILKPVFGDNGRGLRVVESARELAEVDWPEPAALAQHFLPGDGYDLKIYGIGRDLWAVRKPSPLPRCAAGREPPEVVTLTPGMRRIARACGKVFGLDLFGVDCLETAEGLVVVEVNDFPNFSAVPDADDRLAGHVEALRAAI